MVDWRWNSRPSKVDRVSTLTEGDKKWRLFSVGKYAIRVPDDHDGQIEYTTNDCDESKSVLPNLSVVDGEVRIALEDLIPMILGRMEPEEIAQELWANESVRGAFIYAMTERYSGMNVTEKDRRKLLHGLQSAVHSDQLDKAVGLLGNLENRFGLKWFFWEQTAQANRAIESMCPPDFEWRLKEGDHDPAFKIVGTNWQEARAHWRKELMDMFATPEEPVKECPDDLPF